MSTLLMMLMMSRTDLKPTKKNNVGHVNVKVYLKNLKIHFDSSKREFNYHVSHLDILAFPSCRLFFFLNMLECSHRFGESDCTSTPTIVDIDTEVMNFQNLLLDNNQKLM